MKRCSSIHIYTINMLDHKGDFSILDNTYNVFAIIFAAKFEALCCSVRVKLHKRHVYF